MYYLRPHAHILAYIQTVKFLNCILVTKKTFPYLSDESVVILGVSQKSAIYNVLGKEIRLARIGNKVETYLSGFLVSETPSSLTTFSQ